MKKINSKLWLGCYRNVLVLGIMLLCAFTLKAQQQINGRVNDEAGIGVPGVSVTVKNKKISTVTDTNGSFKVNAAKGDVLVVSALGYSPKEVTLSGSSEINITLVSSSEKLNEIVVIGYGTTTKKEATGAIAQVNSKQIEQVPVQNALQALQGRAAGVDITSNTRPGSLGDIRIRGNRSIAASNSPLYVVDGIPLSAGGIDAINPHDIETIDILKDAASTAIYGSRGANGVVLITTKKGKAGAATITYNLVTNFEKIHDLDQTFNAGEYADYRRDAYRAFSSSPTSGYSTPYPRPYAKR